MRRLPLFPQEMRCAESRVRIAIPVIHRYILSNPTRPRLEGKVESRAYATLQTENNSVDTWTMVDRWRSDLAWPLL